MTITLPSSLAQFVDTEVRAGRFPTPDAVVVDALALLQARRGHDEQRAREEAEGMAEFERVFAPLDAVAPRGEPTAEDDAFIREAVLAYRSEPRPKTA